MNERKLLHLPTFVSILVALVILLAACTVTVTTQPSTSDERNSLVIVKPKEKKGHGSGAVIGDGLILTNQHVCAIDDLPQMRVTTYSGHTVPVIKLWVSMDKYDLCLLKVPPHYNKGINWRVLEFAPSNARNGEEVHALGNPLVETFHTSYGRVTKVNYDMGNDWRRGAMRMDMTILPGMSGGPILDSEGRLVGITHSTLVSQIGWLGGVPVAVGMGTNIETVRLLLGDRKG